MSSGTSTATFDLGWEEGCRVLRDRGETVLKVDFLSGEWRRRLRSSGAGSQPLARAVGLPGPPPRVLDATAGLCRDAFLLVGLGCRVTAFERSPFLFELVEDAVRRAEEDPEVFSILSERMRLRLGDAREFLARPEARGAFDVIYLDPMYPEKKKAALKKRELRILRELLGGDKDARQLFDAARAVSPRRIVVKRPPNAPPLAEGAAHSFRGKIARYDLYPEEGGSVPRS